MAKFTTQTTNGMAEMVERTPLDVKARVAEFVDALPAADGVQPLNAGFFKLERMRAQNAAKVRK